MATLTEIFQYQAKQQHGMVLRNAEELLSDVTEFVERLRKHPNGFDANFFTPSCNVNPSLCTRLLTDYAKLDAIVEALKIVAEPK